MSLIALVMARSAGIIRKLYRYPIRLGNADMASRVLTDEENIQLRIELIGRATVRDWNFKFATILANRKRSDNAYAASSGQRHQE